MPLPQQDEFGAEQVENFVNPDIFRLNAASAAR